MLSNLANELTNDFFRMPDLPWLSFQIFDLSQSCKSVGYSAKTASLAQLRLGLRANLLGSLMHVESIENSLRMMH